jgi:hypothetical protein
VLAPLAVLCLALGVYPKPVTDALEPAIDRTLAAYPALVQSSATRLTALPGDEVGEIRGEGALP